MSSTAIKKLASLFFMLGFTLLGFVVLVVSVVLMISLEALKIAIAIQTSGDSGNQLFKLKPYE
jgi:hypothetical protein